MSDQPQSGADVLARIRPVMREETTYLCLRPDLLDAWEEANTLLVKAQGADAGDADDDDGGPRRRLGGGTRASTRKLAEEVQRIENEIEATQIKFTLRAMTKARFRELCDEHPPRKANQYDVMSGYNLEAVWDAAVRECLIDPVFDDASWAEFLRVVNPSEWDELVGVARSVNRSVVSAPKSVLASRILARQGAGSAPPKRGESPRASSTGGPRKRSTNTSTPTDD